MLRLLAFYCKFVVRDANTKPSVNAKGHVMKVQIMYLAGNRDKEYSAFSSHKTGNTFSNISEPIHFT